MFINNKIINIRQLAYSTKSINLVLNRVDLQLKGFTDPFLFLYFYFKDTNRLQLIKN